MKKALITGVSGQDGVYLRELLREQKYQIVGTTRQIDKIAGSIPSVDDQSIEIVEWDLLNQGDIVEILRKHEPEEIYNLAAFTSGAGMYDESVAVGEVNGLAVTRILEAIRKVDSRIRFCQASSREIFGDAEECPQSEQTPHNPRSPYGAAKLYADAMIRIYRDRYNIFACSAILYNHESPHRGAEFVTRKITRTAARVKLGLDSELQIGNLDAERDWGFAGDYVHAMWLMLQQPSADDFLIATGKSHSVRQLCELAFSRLGLDFKDYIRQVDTAFRPSETVQLLGNAQKAKTILGWTPKTTFRDLIHMMVDEDLRRESALLK